MSAGGKDGSLRVILAALIGNLLIAVAKFVAFAFTRSSAMLAEAFHSFADTGNQVLLLVGVRRESRPPDETHPFGYGKESYFWSFVVAISIFTMGGAFAIYEGIHKLGEVLGGAHEPGSQVVGLVVLGVSMGIEGASFLVAYREFRGMVGSRRMWDAITSSRSASVITVLFEDAAAVAGLLIAFVGVSLTAVTGNAVWDAAASIVIGGVLVAVAFFLGTMTKRLLIGQRATAEDEARIREVVQGVEGVDAIVELTTLHMGPDFILLNLSVSFHAGLDVRALERTIDTIEGRVKAAVPAVRRIFIEAESLVPSHEDGPGLAEAQGASR